MLSLAVSYNLAVRSTAFTIDFLEGSTFQGFTLEEHWNGWACPYFTYEQAALLVEAYKGQGFDASYDKDSDGFAFEVESSGGEYDIFSSIEIVGMKLYPVGAFCWIWEEAEESDTTAA